MAGLKTNPGVEKCFEKTRLWFFKLKSLKISNVRLFRFIIFVQFYTDHVLIVLCEFCYNLYKTVWQVEWCIIVFSTGVPRT